MKIVYFAHSVLNRGGDKMVLAHLGQLAASGHQVVIRSNLVRTIFPLHPAIALEKPTLRSKLGTLLCALFERQRCDLVIASIVVTAVLLDFRNRGRVLHFAQDDNETAYRAPFMRGLMRFLYLQAFSVFSLPTIAVSSELAQTFREKYAAGCSVVGNGVDTAQFFPAPSAALVAGKNGRKAVLLLSRRDERKGFDLARQVLAQLEEAGVPVEVWTVGEKAARQGALPHRDFGSVSPERLRAIMSSADLFLYPSRSEGFGLMVLEAFACRCPVVTTEAIGFARDGDNALVGPIGDVAALAGQVARLLEDEELAARLADAGEQFAQQHRLDRSSALFEAELMRLCQRVTTPG